MNVKKEFKVFIYNNRAVSAAVLMLAASVIVTIGAYFHVIAKLQADSVINTITLEAQMLDRIHRNEGVRIYARQSVRVIMLDSLKKVLRFAGHKEEDDLELGTKKFEKKEVMFFETCLSSKEETVKKFLQQCEIKKDSAFESRKIENITKRTQKNLNQLVKGKISKYAQNFNELKLPSEIKPKGDDYRITFAEDYFVVTIPVDISTTMPSKMGVVSSPEYISEKIDIRIIKLFSIALELAKEDYTIEPQKAFCKICDLYPNVTINKDEVKQAIETSLESLKKKYEDKYEEEDLSISLELVDDTNIYVFPTDQSKLEDEDIDTKEQPKKWTDLLNGQVWEYKNESKRIEGRYGLGADLVLLIRAEDKRSFVPYKTGTNEFVYMPIAVEFVIEKRLWEEKTEECSQMADCSQHTLDLREYAV